MLSADQMPQSKSLLFEEVDFKELVALMDRINFYDIHVCSTMIMEF